MNDFQQVFLRWLERERERIVVRPIFDEFDGQNLIFRFDQVTTNIALIVSPSQVRVDAFMREVDPTQRWDNLYSCGACKFTPDSFDMSMEDFSCAARGHDHDRHTAGERRELVIAKHCFEPLRDWIANELAPAYWLMLVEGECTEWARLQMEDDPVPNTEEENVVYEQIKIRTARRVPPRLYAYLRKRGP
jgi:hypothetical protein